MSRSLILGTGDPGKAAEFRILLAGSGRGQPPLSPCRVDGQTGRP